MNTSTVRSRAHPFLMFGIAMLLVGASMPRAFAEVNLDPGSSIKVKFGDLNLSSQSGVSALYRRLDRASRQVCNMENDPVIARMHRSEWIECYQTAFGNAVRDVNNKTLTAMFQQKIKSSSPG
ncbi:MAG: UrcA family protein [Gammaproteobacteria bacterium]